MHRLRLTESPKDGTGQAARSGTWSLSRAGESFSLRRARPLLRSPEVPAQGRVCKGAAKQGGTTEVIRSRPCPTQSAGRERFSF